MNEIKLNLMWTIFWLFCAYSLYTLLVTFIRHDNKGTEIFKNLRIPPVLALYFLVPCVALYLTYKTFGEIGGRLFWILTLFILLTSYFLMLYILVMPEWPVGKFLQIYRVPLKAIRILLSFNFAACLLIIGLCSFVLHKVPHELEDHSATLAQLHSKADQSERDQKESQERIRAVQETATTNVLKDSIGLLTALVSCGTAFMTFLSHKALSHNGSDSKSPGDAKA